MSASRIVMNRVDKECKSGDVFKYMGTLYEVIQDHTSQDDWTPNSTKSLYKDMLPQNVIPEFKAPTGAHDAYQKGDKVIFKGDVYESTIDNNTWSPEDYPQGWVVV